MIQKTLYLLFFFFLLLSCKDEYQLNDKKILRISNSDSAIESGFTSAENIKKYDEDKTYFWTDRYKIFQTQGFASDLILDGEFRKYYRSGQLLEKGSFKKGLKTGVWFMWNENGTVKKKARWKNGWLDGESVVIGLDTTTNTTYKQGLLHGFQEIYVEDTFIEKRKYKKGILMDVQDLNVNNELYIPADTLTIDSQEPSLDDSLSSRKIFNFKLFNKQRDDNE